MSDSIRIPDKAVLEEKLKKFILDEGIQQAIIPPLVEKADTELDAMGIVTLMVQVVGPVANKYEGITRTVILNFISPIIDVLCGKNTEIASEAKKYLDRSSG